MTEQRLRLPVPRPLVAAAVAGALLGFVPVTPRAAEPAAATNGTTAGGGSLTGGTAKDKGDKPNGEDKKDFTIAGNVSGLYPGSSKTLTVTMTNANNFAIRVTSLTAAVADPAGPCTAGVVRVDPMAGTVVVPKNGTATATLTARMANDPSNDCKSTSFGLAYSGTAVKA